MIINKSSIFKCVHYYDTYLRCTAQCLSHEFASILRILRLSILIVSNLSILIVSNLSILKMQ